MKTYLALGFLAFGVCSSQGFADETKDTRKACLIQGYFKGTCQVSTGEQVENTFKIGFEGGWTDDNGFDSSYCMDHYTFQYSSLNLLDTDALALDQYPFNGGELKLKVKVNGLVGERQSKLRGQFVSDSEFLLYRQDKFSDGNSRGADRSYSRNTTTRVTKIDDQHVKILISSVLNPAMGPKRTLEYNCGSLSRVSFVK